MLVLATVERAMVRPRAAAARAVASSPSGCASRCSDMGATITGAGQRRPSTETDASRSVMGTITRGLKRQRRKAAWLSASVTSSAAAPA